MGPTQSEVPKVKQFSVHDSGAFSEDRGAMHLILGPWRIDAQSVWKLARTMVIGKPPKTAVDEISNVLTHPATLCKQFGPGPKAAVLVLID